MTGTQSLRRALPPTPSLWAVVDGESIRQHFQDFCAQFNSPFIELGFNLRWFDLSTLPDKLFGFDSHSPLKPASADGIPSESVNRHGVEELIREDNARDRMWK